MQGKAPTKPSAPETTKRGCSAQYSPHARSLDTRLSPGGGSGVSASPWREGGGWTEPHQPEAAGWAVGGRRKVTHLSSLGWSRRCRRSLTTDFLSKAFSQCFPGGRCARSSHRHLPGTPVLSSDPPQRARTALALASMVSRKERRPGRGCAGARAVVGLTGGWQGCQPPPSEHGSAWAWRRLTRASRAARPGLGLASEP